MVAMSRAAAEEIPKMDDEGWVGDRLTCGEHPGTECARRLLLYTAIANPLEQR